MIATEPSGPFGSAIGGTVEPLNVKRRLTCILAADAVGYSSQMGNDEEGTIRVLSAHRAVIDGIITFHGGRIMSTAGDSVLAEFASAVEAVRCAVEIQEALKTRNDSLPAGSQMQFRVGVNLGDVVVKNDDLLGDGVNVAARLETVAEPGGICISSSVYDQITGKLDLGFQDMGEHALKNISRPIRVYRVSGTSVPGRPGSSARSAPATSRRIPWGLGAVVAAIAAVVAWQTGWLHVGPDHSSTNAVTAAVAPAPTSRAADAETMRLRAEAEALKRQVEAELARVRIDEEASRAARQKADSEAAARRIRAQAEADAARIRSDAEQTAARTKADAEMQAAKVAKSVRKMDAKSSGMVTAAANPAPAAEQVASGSTAKAARFDGAWNVNVDCAATPDGALGYRFDFVAQVKDGFLRGDHGVEGTPGWLRLEGPIQTDGSSKLEARGLTGDPKTSINAVARGLPVGYHVAAQFDASSGSGKRLELRTCNLHFAKR
jgi:class 3 adenylate cyclase